MYITDEEIISTIYKDHLKLNNMKIKPKFKNKKYFMIKHIIKESIWPISTFKKTFNYYSSTKFKLIATF